MDKKELREKLIEIRKAEMKQSPGTTRVFELADEAIELLRDTK